MYNAEMTAPAVMTDPLDFEATPIPESQLKGQPVFETAPPVEYSPQEKVFAIGENVKLLREVELHKQEAA